MILKRSMIIAIVIIGLIVTIAGIGKIVRTLQWRKEVNVLFSKSGDISAKTFQISQLQDLPDPVQKYFRLVLREGQPYISYVRLKHTGTFKTDPAKNWVNIKGEQYFTTEQPGFIWSGATTMFTARDMYVSDKGRLVVFLFSLFKIADGSGETYNQGELLRWLGESVWFPTNLLPGPFLKWEAVNDMSAKLIFSHAGLSISYIVSFNEKGEITQLETKRYMGNDRLETWIGKLSDYTERGGIVIPTKIEAVWKLAKEDYSYAKFQLEKIEFNIPEKFDN